jgi:uncharacterized heparinase superfamily protein
MYQQGLTRVARVLRKPPKVILHRMITEVNAQTDRFRAPRRARRFDAEALLELTESSSVSELWDRLAARLYALPIRAVSERDYDRACPGDGARILCSAEAALAHQVGVFGLAVDLGFEIDWHTDFKTGKSWAPIFMRDIDYVNLVSPSDVKVPWELSRLQWLMPAGQAYLLTGDERYAAGVREVLESWMASNPYAWGVNWACTMEAAMRVLSWTWFFHVFARSRSWADQEFRSSFLRTLYLHGEFTERYLERSDVNGNHFTADAVAMVFAGLFFGKGVAPSRWSEDGWRLLCEELPLQVFPDGVDFEGSIPYHRLVLELFFLAARYREACGLPVPDAYRSRIANMARFTLAYTRPDGSTPLLGDADDARALPFGGQALGDHRYLVGLVGVHWSIPELMDGFSGSPAEVFWTLGARAAASLRRAGNLLPIRSAAFPGGGIFVMRNDRDHVCIDCGPVGLAGRGGHGHNDCLSFEAALDGTHLISDCGAYVYTASAEERNRFRSTASHNTPQIDGEEINRFVGWDHLWTLHNDAVPEVRQWLPGLDSDLFVGTHAGYERLDGIRSVRTIVLDHESHALSVIDECEGSGAHAVCVPVHLAAGVTASLHGSEEIVLTAGGREFLIQWSPASEWKVEIGKGRISPSYGVVVPTVRLSWRRSGLLPATLAMRVMPRAVAVTFMPGRDTHRGACEVKA